MDREAWRATVHGVAKSQTRLNTHTKYTHHLHVESKNYTNEFITKQKQIYRHRKQTYGYQRERRGVINYEFVISRYKLLVINR